MARQGEVHIPEHAFAQSRAAHKAARRVERRRKGKSALRVLGNLVNAGVVFTALWAGYQGVNLLNTYHQGPSKPASGPAGLDGQDSSAMDISDNGYRLSFTPKFVKVPGEMYDETWMYVTVGDKTFAVAKNVSKDVPCQVSPDMKYIACRYAAFPTDGTQVEKNREFIYPERLVIIKIGEKPSDASTWGYTVIDESQNITSFVWDQQSPDTLNISLNDAGSVQRNDIQSLKFDTVPVLPPHINMQSVGRRQSFTQFLPVSI